MKKLFIILPLILLIVGCQKDFNNVVDSQPESYQVIGVYTARTFKYFAGDSLFTISVALNTSSDVKKVSFNIFSPDNNQLNNSPIQLFDNGSLNNNGDTVKGDNVYSNKFSLSYKDPIGTYEIYFYITSNSGNTSLAAVHDFTYDNNQVNVAPVISDLVAPDTVSLGSSTTPILLTVKVQDGNGLKDIQSVFFNSFIPPNGNPSSGNPFLMYDDGTNGDVTAGDGIYSLTVGLPPTALKGTYRFEFQAKDRGGLLSNKITHNIVVK